MKTFAETFLSLTGKKLVIDTDQARTFIGYLDETGEDYLKLSGQFTVSVLSESGERSTATAGNFTMRIKDIQNYSILPDNRDGVHR